MNKIINVGIIGYGMSSEIFHSPFINTMDEFKLSAIVTTNEIGINKIKTKYPSTKIYSTVDKILSDKTIQLIIITTPNKSHFEITKKSLLSNKNVIVEKPFTLTVDKANELIKLAHNENRMLTVYHNRRFDSDFLTIKKIISNKTLGILKSYESHFDRFRPIALTNRWREKNELGAGTLYDLGSHLIDQALDLFGMPDKIFADIIIERENAEIEDCFSLTLYYSNFRVYLKSSTLVAGKNLRFQLNGTKGTFRKYGLDIQEEDLKNGETPLTKKEWGVEPKELWGTLNTSNKETIIESINGDYRLFYKNIYNHLLFKEDLLIKPEEARDVIIMIEKAYESNRLKKVINIKNKE